jgi:hypothetical protein
MVNPINRIKHLMQEVHKNGEEKNTVERLGSQNSGPAIEIDALKKGFADLQEAEEEEDLDFGGIDNFDFDDDDDGDDDDDDDDDDEYLQDKLKVARDVDSVITEARVIFQKDPETGKVFMTARLDEMDLPDYFSPDGGEMFKSDIIIRIFGKAFASPKKTSEKIDSRIFKKKNWQDKI